MLSLPLIPPPTRPVLMAHVMPWFAAPPTSKEWGWHWTMGKTDAAKGDLATHYRPLDGPYDSADPHVVERQALQMKIAGFDGMLVDWYGDRDRYDYLPNHRNTQLLFEAAKRVGLSFALVYEDQTVPNIISGGVFKKEDAVAEGKALFERARKAWFGFPTYQKVEGKPLLLVFGPQYYPEETWTQILPNVAFFTLHHRRGPAVGAYDWPLPGEDWEKRRREVMGRPNTISVAFPRFHDYYKQAGVSAGYGSIPDDNGRTYERTLAEALAQKAPITQVATWNDWGEGTQIEPSKEFGYRDLETTQRQRRKIDPKFAFTPADLRLPSELYARRKRGGNKKQLDAATKAISQSKPGTARKLLGKA